MKGFGIEIKNNLLEPKHIKNMGVSVWMYMWLVDKMTSVSEEGIGKVLGGKPIKYEEDVKKELGISQDTYTNWIEKLEKYPYIETTRTPYGIVFRVLKAHKRFRKNSESIDSAKTRNLVGKNAESNKTVDQKTESEDEEIDSFVYKKNKEYIDSNKDKFLSERFNFPEKDGSYNWKYFINHGKGLNPVKLFFAKYIERKEALSDGIFSYSKNKDKNALVEIFRLEMSNAKKLSNMFSYEEFIKLLEFTDGEAWDEKKKEYKFEWKLSTTIKYSAKFNGQKED